MSGPTTAKSTCGSRSRHNRLSAFGVSGPSSFDQPWWDVELSQSPFGFWGEWTLLIADSFFSRTTCHNRLSAFGVSGPYAIGEVFRHTDGKVSQSPFGFWGEWTNPRFYFGCRCFHWSQSPFGFWGEWTYSRGYGNWNRSPRHNRLSAFGVSGPHGTVCNLVYRRNRHNRLSAFGVSGPGIRHSVLSRKYNGHNRLSAFGVIGTSSPE